MDNETSKTFPGFPMKFITPNEGIATPYSEQHVYNHYVPNAPTINAKAEKNTKGYNYEVTVIGASDPAQAAALAFETMQQLKATFEPPMVNEPDTDKDTGGTK